MFDYVGCLSCLMSDWSLIENLKDVISTGGEIQLSTCPNVQGNSLVMGVRTKRVVNKESAYKLNIKTRFKSDRHPHFTDRLNNLPMDKLGLHLICENEFLSIIFTYRRINIFYRCIDTLWAFHIVRKVRLLDGSNGHFYLPLDKYLTDV